jgi:hypothetical protein
VQLLYKWVLEACTHGSLAPRTPGWCSTGLWSQARALLLVPNRQMKVQAVALTVANTCCF